MKRTWSISLAAVLLSSCAHRNASVTAPALAANTAKKGSVKANKSSVKANMDRQVRNAIDAGEGDLTSRRLRERIAADPGNQALRFELADHYRKTGYTDLAMEHYRLMLERNPQDEKALVLLAQCFHDEQDTETAVRTLQKYASGHTVTNPETPAWLGFLLDSLDEAAKAEDAHRLAVSMAPRTAKFRNNLGFNLLTQGRRDDAIAEFRQALEIEPHLRIAHNNLALALMKNPTEPDRKEALLHWQSVGDPATAHNNMAVALMEQRDYAGARKELELSLGYRRDFTPAMYNLAVLAEMDGAPAVLPVPSRTSATHKTGVKRVWDLLAGTKEARPGGVQTASAGSKVN